MVNWLADTDLLPAAIPRARIFTFDYQSRWHKDAPYQRRSLCANQLITALDTKRQAVRSSALKLKIWAKIYNVQEEDTRYRPLIFIGHSFGGIVIEEALVEANQADGPFQYLAISTIGIVLLGTPHHGSKAAKWGELMAVSGKGLGLGSEERILKDLQLDSEPLNDLRYKFTLWLFRYSVATVCFFEQDKTDYGRKFGVPWKEMVSASDTRSLSS